jgi:hypothetical protein
MSYSLERRLLQFSIAAAGMVPVAAGFEGLISGLGAPGLFEDSHYRYLSGILLAIGAAFWWTIPRIDDQGRVVRLVTFLVVVGGLARLGAAFASGGGLAVDFALVMELVVTPALCLWRERVERMDRGRPPGYRGPWE